MIKKKINQHIYFFLFLILNINISISTANEKLEYELTAIKIEYNENKNLITATGDAVARDTKGKVIKSPKIIYDKKNKIIKTFSNSIYEDDKKNKIFAENFIYDLSQKKITASNNVKYEDNKGNYYLFDTFDYYEMDEKGNGTNLKATNIDNSKIKALSASIDNKSGNVTFENGATYTTCKFNFEEKNYFFNNLKVLKNCPEWEIVSKKTRHNKNEKMIYHDHPILKLKGLPVFYTPYFSHPDPTVKRKSGFLTPSFLNNDNYGRSTKTPYFYVLNDKEDITFTPIIYFDENPIFLSEYRRVGKNNKLVIDSSYTSGYRKDRADQTDGSRNHFFLKFNQIYEDLFSARSELNFNLQRISQKTYLKSHEILTPYVNPDIRYLNNEFDISFYKEEKNLKVSARIYENLRDANSNTKYQYTLPEINYSDFFSYLNYDINLNSDFYATNYGGDSNKVELSNNIAAQSEQKIIKSIGLGNVFKATFYNIEKYNKKIEGEKENFNIENYLTVASDLTYPLYKSDKSNLIEQTLIPRLFVKYTPGSMDPSNRTFTFNEVFSMNRANNSSNPDTGLSVGHGISWELSKKKDNFDKYFVLNSALGQVLRFDDLPEMSSSSSLNQKKSNIVGYIDSKIDNAEYKENPENQKISSNMDGDIFAARYDFAIDNNARDIYKHDINISKNYKSNIIEVSYSESRKNLGSSRTGTLDLKKYFTEDFSMNISATKNFVTHSTETNSIAVIYENDCIKVSGRLDKKFYNDTNIKPSNSFLMEIVLKPFGENIAPDISPLLKID